MTPLALVVVAAVALAAPVVAARPTGVALAFGNTIKAIFPDGRFQRYWLEPDGHWQAIGRRGHASAGKWTADDDRLCLRQTRPIPSPFRYCTSFPPHARLGVAWAATSMGGDPIRLVVLRGRV